MTYSKDFREKVLKIKEKEKLSIAKTAARFGIGTTTIVNWLKNIIPKNKRNRPTSKINMELLVKDVKEYQDSYVYERAQRLGCSKNGVWYALKRLNITYKKSSKTPKGQRRRSASIYGEDKELSSSK